MANLNRTNYVNCLGLLRYWPQTNSRPQNQPDLKRYGEIFTAWLEGKSYSQIGKEFGIGKERVRQILSQTAAMLRQVFKSCKIKIVLGE